MVVISLDLATALSNLFSKSMSMIHMIMGIKKTPVTADGQNQLLQMGSVVMSV